MQRRSWVLILALSALPWWQSQAEVRVFWLRIAKKSNPGDFRLVKSTLDPLQYRYFYPIEPDEVITYDETWRCTDRTGDFQPLCPSPKELAAEKANADGSSQGPESKP